MKKLTAIILLITLGVFAFASTPLTFSGNYALVGANSRTIRKTTTDIEGTGVIFATGDERATAEGSYFSLLLGENSLVSISDENGLVIYLVYGSATLQLSGEREITLYTPVSSIVVNTKCEIGLISTDNEEIVFNYSLSPITAFDSIRRKEVKVDKESGFNYIKNKEVDLNGETKKVIIPSTPIFLDYNSSLTGTPEMPKGLNNERELADYPRIPEGLKSMQYLSPDAPEIRETTRELSEKTESNGITVFRTLVDDEGDN